MHEWQKLSPQAKRRMTNFAFWTVWLFASTALFVRVVVEFSA
jgi:hypothetical protein